MPQRADPSSPIRRICRIVGAAGEDALPAYVRDRVEQELRPMLVAPLMRPDDPAVLQTADAIARDFVMLSAAARIDTVCKELREAQPALNRRRAEQDARQAAMDRRQATLDARQAEQDARQAALDQRQDELDRRQAALDARQAEQDRRQAALDARENRLAAAEAAMQDRSGGVLARLAGALGLGSAPTAGGGSQSPSPPPQAPARRPPAARPGGGGQAPMAGGGAGRKDGRNQ